MITPILKFTQKITWHLTNVTIGTYLASAIINDVKKDTLHDKEIEPEDIDKADMNEDKLYLKERQTRIRNKRFVHNIIYGHCSPSIQEVLEGYRDYENNSDDSTS